MTRTNFRSGSSEPPSSWAPVRRSLMTLPLAYFTCVIGWPAPAGSGCVPFAFLGTFTSQDLQTWSAPHLNKLVHLRVLRLGLLQDWDVGVGVFSGCEDVPCSERGQRARWGNLGTASRKVGQAHKPSLCTAALAFSSIVCEIRMAERPQASPLQSHELQLTW